MTESMTTTKRSRIATMATLALWTADLALLGLVLMLPVIWVWEHFLFEIGPFRGRLSWNWKPMVALVAFCVARVALKRWLAATAPPRRRAPWDHPAVRRIGLAVGSVLLFFLGFEAVLTWRGFEGTLPPIVIQGADEGTEWSRAHIPDRELLWRFAPGHEFRGRMVNNLGFLDRPVDPEKKPGSVRVICMGDSCTAQGIPPYSGFLHQLFTEAPPDEREWEAFNMAVHGYSSSQGLRLFLREGRALRPDYVTIFYGWNDHWLGHRPDSSRMAMAVPAFAKDLMEGLKQKRFFQWMVRQATRERGVTRAKDGLGPRVPHEEYRWNLHAFARAVRGVGGQPVFITAPRAEELTPLLLEKQANSLEETTRWHDEYIEITREVAEKEGALLLDLAAMFEGPAGAHYFSGDGIHFTRDGRKRIAREIYMLLAGTDEPPPVHLE